MAACFIKASKVESPPDRQRLQTYVTITEMTAYHLGHILLMRSELRVSPSHKGKGLCKGMHTRGQA